MLELIYPPSRIESLLAKAIGEEEAMPAPEWLDVPRLEAYLTVLTGGEADLPEYPMSNIEKFLAYKCGQTDVELPTPITRIEKFLAKDTPAEPEEMPEPQTRIEQYLYEWEPGGGGDWYTYTGNLPATITAVAHAIASLTRYGLCTQDGTPTPDAPVDIVTNNGAIKVSQNLCDVVSANIVVGQYIDNSGTARNDSANFFYAPLIPVDATKTYTMHTSVSLAYFSVMEYDSSRGFLRRDLFGTSSVAAGDTITFTVSADCAYIRFGSNIRKSTISESNVLAIDWMLTQTETAQDYRPYGEIYAGGTHPGQNLVDLTAVTDGYYYDQDGVYTELADARLTDFIPVKAGQKYTVYVKAQRAGVSANVRCNLFDSAKVWKSQSRFSVNSGSEAVGVITPTENGYLRVSANYAGTGAKADWSTLQIVRGEYTLATMPPYEAYTEIPYTPEVLTVSGINLLDPSTSSITIGQYYNANGTLVNGVNNWRTGFIPITGGKTYAFWGRAKADNTISAYNRINWFTANKTNISPRPSYTVDTVTVGTAPSNAAFATLSCSPFDSDDAITREQFDLYNWMFAEASAEIPYQPYVTPQTVGWKNLFDSSSYTEINAYVNANTGVLTTGSPGSMTQYCAVIPCEPNTQYNITGQGTSAWGAFTSDSIGTTATAFTKGGNLTTGANDRYLIGLVRANGDSIDYRNTLVVRETVTDIPMLLGVGNYKDEAELIQGIKTGKIGVKVFDGTETFTVSSSGAMITAIPDVAVGAQNTPMNTHFALETSPTAIAVGTQRFGARGTEIYSANYYMKHTSITTVADFKTWLAAQYAAGTPVIVIYPLATETTEQTTPQHLVTHKGTNVVDSVANVSPVEAEIEYYSDTPPNLSLGRGLMGARPISDNPEEPIEEEPSEEISEEIAEEPSEEIPEEIAEEPAEEIPEEIAEEPETEEPQEELEQSEHETVEPEQDEAEESEEGGEER